MDVLWFRAGKRENENESVFARVENGKMMVTFDRGDYWQCAYVIAKGQYDAVKARGLDAFRDDVVGMAPILKSGMSDVKTWDDVKLLTVAINRLKRWTLPGTVLHRRRRACDVAGRRRRRQPRGPGRGRNREPAGRKACRWLSARARTRRGAPAPGISGADDAGHAGDGAEQYHQRRAQAGRPAAEASAVHAADQRDAVAAGYHRAVCRASACGPSMCNRRRLRDRSGQGVFVAIPSPRNRHRRESRCR